jgi:pimeloyl-ACP methyl ester carboxylesterase
MSSKTFMRSVLGGAIATFISANVYGDPTQSAYLHAQSLVAVQGTRHLNLYCIGKGTPTVIFDSGLADSMAVWRLVQPTVAKTTRACAYDRAGYGFSDPPDGPSDAKSAVSDIARLISAANISTPVVYVGHSIAGIYGVMLATTRPRDVAAEVLVDPSFANQFFAMASALPPKERPKYFARMQSSVQQMKKCATLPAPLPKDCLGGDSQTGPNDKQLAALERQRVSRRSYIETNASEWESAAPDVGRKSLDQTEMEALKPAFGDKPLLILTHSKNDPSPDLTAQQNAAMERAWNDGHNQLAALSTRGSNTVVPNSTHYIQIDQPQVVIDAVLKAVSEVRQMK